MKPEKMNLLFFKTMSDTDIEAVKKAFYTKESLAELLNGNIKNTEAINVITDKYQKAYEDWSNIMNDMQNKYLNGNSFDDATFNINFTTKEFELIFKEVTETESKAIQNKVNFEKGCSFEGFRLILP